MNIGPWKAAVGEMQNQKVAYPKNFIGISLCCFRKREKDFTEKWPPILSFSNFLQESVIE